MAPGTAPTGKFRGISGCSMKAVNVWDKKIRVLTLQTVYAASRLTGVRMGAPWDGLSTQRQTRTTQVESVQVGASGIRFEFAGSALKRMQRAGPTPQHPSPEQDSTAGTISGSAQRPASPGAMTQRANRNSAAAETAERLCWRSLRAAHIVKPFPPCNWETSSRTRMYRLIDRRRRGAVVPRFRAGR